MIGTFILILQNSVKTKLGKISRSVDGGRIWFAFPWSRKFRICASSEIFSNYLDIYHARLLRIKIIILYFGKFRILSKSIKYL